MYANNYLKAVVRADADATGRRRILAQTFVPFDDSDPAQVADAARTAVGVTGLSIFRACGGIALPVIGRGGGF